MKDKEKEGYIVPLGINFGGSIIGDPYSNYLGLPLFLKKDEPEEDMDEL